MPSDPVFSSSLEESYHHRPAKTRERPPKLPAHPPTTITYKLFERLLLTHLSSQIDAQLIDDQAGFRPGKSCTGQLLNLTQYIEDGYQKKLITANLTAAYDTVQHRLLIKKLYDMTCDAKLCSVIRCLLSNRMFYGQMFLCISFSR